MKSAEEWMREYIDDPSEADAVAYIRHIQADALKHAADKLTRHIGDWQSIIADLQYQAKKLISL